MYSTSEVRPLPLPTGRARCAGRLAFLVAAPFLTVAVAFELINAFPHGLTYDDAYFYAQIAYNVGELGRSTFDGLNITSGYHLLWGGLLGALSSVVALFTSDKIVHLYLFEVTFAGLALATAWVFSRPVERFGVVALVVMGTLLMETLALSALLLVFARAETQTSSSASTRPTAAACALLVPLARIDAAIIVAIYVLCLALEGQVRHAGRLLAALAVGVTAQVALMLWLFGEPFSVSSMIKASNAAPFGAAMWASVSGPGAIVLGYVVRSTLFVGLTAAAIGTCIAGGGSTRNRRLLYLSVGAAAFSGGHVVSQLVPFWCYLPAYLIHFYAVTHSDPPRWVPFGATRVVVRAVAILGLVFLAHKVYLFAGNRDIIRGARAFTEEVARHVPRDARIYQIDGSGFTGFFTNRAVVNGDGLVNTYEYARRAREGRLAGYLDEQNICYIITNVALHGDVLVEFGGLRVTTAETEEVLRSPAYGLFPTSDFVLHRRLVPSCGRSTHN